MTEARKRGLLLSYVLLCYVTLRYVTLHCVMSCYVMLRYVRLWGAIFLLLSAIKPKILC